MNKYFKAAQLCSTFSDFRRCKTGCVAVYGNNVIAQGWNSNKTNPMQARYNNKRGFDGYTYPARIHAEMMVLSKIKYLDIDMSQVKLYVWSGHDLPKCSKPCPACECAIRMLGIRKVFYTGNNSFIKEVYN